LLDDGFEVALHPARAGAACNAVAHAVRRYAQADLDVSAIRLGLVAAFVLQALYAQIAADVGHDLFGTACGAAHGGVAAGSQVECLARSEVDVGLDYFLSRSVNARPATLPSY
jgi:hypothetical protein